MGTFKPQSSNTVIGTLAVDGWAVTFGRARKSLGKLQPRLLVTISNFNSLMEVKIVFIFSVVEGICCRFL